MGKVRVVTLGGAVALAFAVLPLRAHAAPANHQNDMLIVDVEVTCAGQAQYRDRDGPWSDKFKGTLTDHQEHRITKWDEGGVEREKGSENCSLSIEGGGQAPNAPDPYSHWSYSVDEQPKATGIGVSIAPNGHGEIHGARGECWSKPNVKITPTNVDVGGLWGAGAQPTNEEEFKRQLKFTFDPGQERVSLGGTATLNMQGRNGDGTMTSTVTYTVHWRVSLGPQPTVECIIEPGPGYEKWEPKGGPDEKTMGNKLNVRAYLQVKDHPDQVPLQRAKKFHFELVGVSQEPGVALNVPLEGAGTEPDLKIEQSPTIEPKEEGRVGESNGGGITYANAIVGCYDYGAYGSLRVTAELTDGSVIYGHLKGQPGKEELAIPLDDNHNHIADAWEQRMGIFGKNLPAEWDGQTEPPLDDTPGDGISLYEKYRGLVHKGAPVKWDLNVKNLVVVNEIGDTVQPGLKLFQSASGVHVVELSKGELPDNRVVNTNGSTGVESLQHALRLTSQPLGAGIIGLAMPANVIKKSPGDCTEMAINSDLSFIPAAMRAQLFAVGIAHEFGHALGAQHHGDSPSGTTRENLVINDLNVEIVDSDGHAITQRPFTLEGAIETKVNGGESSGNQDCVMRNSSFFQWVQRVDNNGRLHYYAAPPTPPGTTFCSTREGTGINADKNTPLSFFGNSAQGRGECTKHMRVRD